MKVMGFTGSRNGVTEAQRKALMWLILHHMPEAVHHGCCVGADAHFAAFCDSMGARPYMVGHPSDLTDLTSPEAVLACDLVHDRLPPLERNREIVDACELLVACPDGPEQQKSGTWATIRYARKVGKQTHVIFPDGTSIVYGGDPRLYEGEL